VLLYGSETWTVKASDTSRISAAGMKYMRRTAGYIGTDCKTNCKGVKNNSNFGQITGIKDKLDTTCKQKPRNRLPRVMKHCCVTGRRNYGRLLKRLLDT
jgi:hypothetical protein